MQSGCSDKNYGDNRTAEQTDNGEKYLVAYMTSSNGQVPSTDKGILSHRIVVMEVNGRVIQARCRI